MGLYHVAILMKQFAVHEIHRYIVHLKSKALSETIQGLYHGVCMLFSVINNHSPITTLYIFCVKNFIIIQSFSELF